MLVLKRGHAQLVRAPARSRTAMEKLNAMVMAGGAAEKSFREYRRGNWTLNETMVLIEAKKQDYGRRLKRFKESDRVAGAGSAAGDGIIARSQETRWKWVEDYCWRYGCFRSQNQCNDRWDNLMRDYKKVRTYELGAEGCPDHVSYWSLERHERKRRCLPCNLMPEIYQALTEVAQMRGGVERASVGVPPVAGSGVEEEQGRGLSCSIPHTCPVSRSHASEPPPPPPPPRTQPLAATAASDSEDSEHSDSHERKRKREESSSGRSSNHDLNSAISKCASILTEALQASQQREETRHKDLIKIEERKARIEESKLESSAQTMNSLATSINKLASSILGLVTDKGGTGASK